ncbi:MAG TPA: 2-oxoglutarate dehydrogenase, E2 component, dihydrolipoamide succinyltransferase [Gemmatimonadales bacterium]|nr:2-oxoglutarate dehydrogenase, E2 component, dihydrolipoamide succinyltransferase [Gemmatimonadales bacterium]
MSSRRGGTTSAASVARAWSKSCAEPAPTRSQNVADIIQIPQTAARGCAQDMARVDVIMPQMGESIAEGTVARWLKKVGDPVKRDEPILEISTDKVDAEIPSPASGVLSEIKVGEGKTVAVQTVIAVIDTDGAQAAPPAKPAAPAAPTVSPAPAAPAAPAAPPAAATPHTPAASAPPKLGPAPSGPAAPLAVSPGPETAEERLRRRSTPLVRKIAAEHSVDIAQLQGTGHAGRVTKKDILEYIERGAATAAPAAPVAPGLPAGAAAPAAVLHPTSEPWPGDRVEPMSRIRKLTADHMVVSRRVSAHVTSFYEVDFTHVARLRERHKAAYEQRGAKLTYLAFITKTIADNLRRHPVLNASVSGDNIIYRGQVNIGIAVALDWGLIVPVLRNADELSLLGIARQMADLAERARTKRLSPDEVQKGTFTITNPGVFGSYTGAPIINQPQVAILGVGAIEKRPRVITLDDGQDVIAIRTMGMLALSYDHRIVDGADADRFMADVKRGLEAFPAEGV